MRAMRRLGRDGDRESGMSTLEVVLLAPLVIGFVMFLVCFGVLVNAHGTVQGAARDAARAGSLQRDVVSANNAATAAAQADLGGSCSTFTVTHVPPLAFAAGQLYAVQVTCVVSMTGLDWFNIGDQTITGYSAAPLDTFRRTTN